MVLSWYIFLTKYSYSWHDKRYCTRAQTEIKNAAGLFCNLCLCFENKNIFNKIRNINKIIFQAKQDNQYNLQMSCNELLLITSFYQDLQCPAIFLFLSFYNRNKSGKVISERSKIQKDFQLQANNILVDFELIGFGLRFSLELFHDYSR